jgi:hypothetical protein
MGLLPKQGARRVPKVGPILRSENGSGQRTVCLNSYHVTLQDNVPESLFDINLGSSEEGSFLTEPGNAMAFMTYRDPLVCLSV